MTPTIERGRTAMARTFFSRPVANALSEGVIDPQGTFFDYGCGRGGDVRRLQGIGIKAAGWDPAFDREAARTPADVVNLGYVANVIEDPTERTAALRAAWGLTKGVLIVAARLRWEESSISGRNFGDGVVTSKRTFQKFFTQEELRAWIDSVLSVKCVAAAPGIFYVFRSSALQQSFLARRSRSATQGGIRVADVLFDAHRAVLEPLQSFVNCHRRLPGPHEFDLYGEVTREFGSIQAAFSLVRRATGPARWSDVIVPNRRRTSDERFAAQREVLEPLIEFAAERGRLPRPDELVNAAAVVEAFGGIRPAFSLVRRVTGGAKWESVEQARKRDFLVYLALAAFGGRPRFSDLPPDLQFDVKDFFGSFKEVTRKADQLLFAAGDIANVDLACSASLVGKLTHEALYVHASAVGELSPLLRVYDGCARTLTGTVDDATVLKLNRLKSQVSYLSYPSFDRDPHPSLATVVIGRLGSLDVTFRDFRSSDNPPILHRKETFVPAGYSGREKFERLTRQEERHGLLSEGASTIGTRNGWHQALSEKGLEVRGHRVVRARGGLPSPSSDALT